jgi:hypothetical protein
MSEIPPRPQSNIGRRHNIVEKDYFRLLHTEKIIKQGSEKRHKKTPLSIQKFKTRSDLLIDEYRRPTVSKDKLYMIEKVARLRAAQGRYGVDHSEVLNFEFEVANKQRADHMNTLVYKKAALIEQDAARQSMHRTKSNAIFERLTEKEVEEHLRRSSFESSEQTSSGGITFNEWLRKKDAEQRMKKKLILEAKNEMRQELFELAQQEQADADFKMKMMEEWAL